MARTALFLQVLHLLIYIMGHTALWMILMYVLDCNRNRVYKMIIYYCSQL